MDRRRYGASGGNRARLSNIGFLDISELIQGRKGALKPMYRCVQSKLRILTLFSTAAMLSLSAVAQDSGAAQQNAAQSQSAAAQSNDPAAQSVPNAPLVRASSTAVSQRPTATDSEVGKIDFSKSRKPFPNMLAACEGRTLRSRRLPHSTPLTQWIDDDERVLSLNNSSALALGKW